MRCRDAACGRAAAWASGARNASGGSASISSRKARIRAVSSTVTRCTRQLFTLFSLPCARGVGNSVGDNRTGPGVADTHSLGQGVSMDSGEGRMRMVEGPVVEAADPWDPESRTAELARPSAVAENDPVVPPESAGLPGWLTRWRGVLRRCAARLVPVGLLAALPMHYFVGRVDDTVIAAPALSDLLGGFGLLLLPLMWLAYFTVSALPLVICLAGVVAVGLAEGATGALPGLGRMWRLVAYRLRPLWAWFAGLGLLTQALPLLLTADR